MHRQGRRIGAAFLAVCTAVLMAGLAARGAPPGGGTNACPAGQVSCGSAQIDYSTDSTVSTGSTPTASKWLVGTMLFRAVGASGGQVWSMGALAKPKNICPANLGGLTRCTLQMNLDDIPAPYQSPGDTLLTLICHVSRCPAGPLGTAGLQMFAWGNGGLSVKPILPCIGSLPFLCFTAKRITGGHLKIKVKNLTAGDPKIAGRCIAGC